MKMDKTPDHGKQKGACVTFPWRKKTCLTFMQDFSSLKLFQNPAECWMAKNVQADKLQQPRLGLDTGEAPTKYPIEQRNGSAASKAFHRHRKNGNKVKHNHHDYTAFQWLFTSFF